MEVFQSLNYLKVSFFNLCYSSSPPCYRFLEHFSTKMYAPIAPLLRYHTLQAPFSRYLFTKYGGKTEKERKRSKTTSFVDNLTSLEQK